MAAPRTIPASQVTDLVTFNVLINGEEIPKSVPILSISVQREINKIPFARICIIDGDPSAEDFPISNESYFVPGNEVEIKLGYRNNNVTTFKGIVVGHSTKITSKKAELLVECKDEAVKLTIGKKSKHYENVTDSDIAEEIIDSYNLEKEIESSSIEHKELIQFHTTDWDFMISRMDVIGRICTVEDGKITIKKPALTESSVLDVLYGATILDYHAEIDSRTQFNEIKSKTWDYTNQEIIEDTADPPDMNVVGNLIAEDLAGVIGLESNLLIHSGKLTNEQVKEWANAKMLRSRLAKVRGAVKFQGFPNVKPGMIITLNGVGNRFNGPVLVCSVRHDCNQGNWTTEASFGMPESWFAESVNPFHLSSQLGFIPSVQGLQIGIVTDLEDPEGEHRVKVKLPVVSADEEGVWMRIATLDAGNNRGTFFRPELSDEVIVGFIFNDPNNPVILGMLHSSALPAPLTASNDNHEKGYVSRSEMKMIFNDDEKSYKLETPGGKKITLSDKDGIVQIEDENGNKIKMESSGITVESATDLILKAGKDMTLEANKIKLTASAQFSLSASGDVAIEGAMTKIAASGITEIKGALVKIN